MPERTATGEVLRISRFSRASLWSAIDQSIRDAMPEYRSQTGMEAVWFGRRGPASGDERMIVTLWDRAEAEAESMAIPEMLGGDVDVVAPTRLVLPVAFSCRREATESGRILRLYEGRTPRAQLDRYLAVAAAGSSREIDLSDGPLAVVRCVTGPARFLTVSVWPEWSSLQAHTGGDIDQPILSRDRSLLLEGRATHYELVH